MSNLQQLWQTLKERFMSSLQETQESQWFITLKERYEELSPLMQRIVNLSAASLALLFLLWWPVSNVMDSWDLTSQFEDHRNELRDLIQVQSEMAESPALPLPPDPEAIKAQYDAKIMGLGIKPEQVKSTTDPVQKKGSAEERGLTYTIENLTVRQIVGLVYEFDHLNVTVKLTDLKIYNNQSDPHYFQAQMKLVSYVPKQASAQSDLLDAIKKKKKDTGKGGL